MMKIYTEEIIKSIELNKNIIVILVIFTLITSGIIVKADTLKANTKNSSISQMDSIHGQVIKVYTDIKTDNSSETYCNADVKVLSGKLKGQTITVQNFLDGNANGEQSSSKSIAKLGDEVLLSIDQDTKGNIKNAYIYDVVRYKYIYKLGTAFIILLILVGGKKGVKSVITLAITGFAVLKILIPLVMKGYNATVVSSIICIFVIVVNLLIISGKNKKTLAAIIGTSGGVLTAGAIAIFSNTILRVNGLTDEEVQSMIYTIQNPNFNFTGLLFAGIIMGALGAVMDVSMSIASSMKEIRDIRPDITRKELIRSGMNVGKDIMGTMANTLILAYAGGALFMMIMVASYTKSISTAINQDIIASEILKALAGSIGLIFSVPITVIVSAILITKNKEESYLEEIS